MILPQIQSNSPAPAMRPLKNPTQSKLSATRANQKCHMKANPNQVNVRFLPAFLPLLLLSAVSTQAVDRFWTGGTASYNNAANWGGTIPNGGDNAIVNNGGTVLINSGDPAWTTFDIRAGQVGGDGSYIQDGPTVTLNSWFRLAVDDGTTGTYTLKSGILNADPAFH